MKFRRRLLPVATCVVAFGVNLSSPALADPGVVIIDTGSSVHTLPENDIAGIQNIVNGLTPGTSLTITATGSAASLGSVNFSHLNNSVPLNVAGNINIASSLSTFNPSTTGSITTLSNFTMPNINDVNITNAINSAGVATSGFNANVTILGANIGTLDLASNVTTKGVLYQTTSNAGVLSGFSPGAAGNQGITAPISISPKTPSFNIPAQNNNSPNVVPAFTARSFVNLGVPTDKVNWNFNLQSPKPLFGKKGQKNPPLLKTLNYTRNPYQPVAAGVPRAMPFMQLNAIDREPYSVRHDGTAELTSNDSNELGIKSGSIFIVAHKPIIVSHNDIRITLGAGAIAYVSASSNCLVVRTLHDKHMKDVKVSFAKESLDVPVGTELCIGTDENAVLEEINKDTMVRRNSLGTKVSSGKFGLTSTFPLHSMLAHPMLVNMYRNRIEDRPHIEKLMRMAACLHLVGRNSH